MADYDFNAIALSAGFFPVETRRMNAYD